MSSQFQLAIAAFLLVGMATAQGRPSRGLGSIWDAQPSRPDTDVRVDDTGKVWLLNRSLSGTSTASFTTGITHVGSYDVDGGAEVMHVVVSGRDATGGRVEHWARNGSGGWSFQSSYSLAGADFSAVAHDGSVLYLVDCVSHSILRAPWQTSQSLSGLTFALWATTTEVPALAAADSQYLLYLPTGAATNLPGAGLFLVNEIEMFPRQRGTLIRDITGLPVAQSYTYAPFEQTVAAVADETTARDGGTTLTVIASDSTSLEVVDSASTVIGTGAAPTGGGSVVLTLSTPLVIGETYTVRPVGSSQGVPFKCLRRHGSPETFSNGASMTRMRLIASEYTVGNQTFTARCRAVRSGGVGPRLGFVGGMILGLGDAPIIPYDNGQGTNEFLVTDYWVGAEGFIAENTQSGSIEMGFPIPNDPGLEGLVLLGQFVVTDGVAFQLSEVIGFKLGAAN